MNLRRFSASVKKHNRAQQQKDTGHEAVAPLKGPFNKKNFSHREFGERLRC